MSDRAEGADLASASAANGCGDTSHEAQQLLEVVFDASESGLALVSGEELRFVRANPAYRALTPHPERDPVGRTFDEVWDVSGGCIAEEIRRPLRTGEPLHRDDQPVTIAGACRFFSYQVKRVLHAGREALFLVLSETTALVEARRAAEEAAAHALRHAAELDAVIDAIADGFVLYGADGEVLRMNAPAAALVHDAAIEPRSAFADLCARLVLTSPEGRILAPREGPVPRALAGEIVHGMPLHVSVPGTSRTAWIVASAAPIRSPGGAVVGAVMTFSDQSAFRALQEARDDLVRMISHDLRTPLNAVYTQAHLLRRAPDDPAKVAERARSISRSCERMSAMIKDLVETALLESGQLVLDRAPVDVEGLVREILDRLRGGLDVDRVQLVLHPPLPLADVDPERVERALVNLLSNALKYSPAETPVLLALAPCPGGIEVTVRDRGIGIAPEDQPHVFERFFRARGARRPEGLGLGLYIARLVVEAHGGRVEVESALGQGSTFRVVLPAARDAGGGFAGPPPPT